MTTSPSHCSEGSIEKLWNHFGFFWVKKTKRRWWMGSQGREIGQGVIRQFAFSLFENIWGGGGVEIEQLCHRTRKAVTCESLVSREFSRILLTFHFSILRHFHFTFPSWSRFHGIFISLFILEMSEWKTKFTFQFSKRVKAFQISLFFSRKKSEILHATSHFVMKNLHFWSK